MAASAHDEEEEEMFKDKNIDWKESMELE